MSMFPEYQDLFRRLTSSDPHFSHLVDRHRDLNERIQKMESGVVPAKSAEIETLKKKKLLIKDEVYRLLREADSK